METVEESQQVDLGTSRALQIFPCLYRIGVVLQFLLKRLEPLFFQCLSDTSDSSLLLVRDRLNGSAQAAVFSSSLPRGLDQYSYNLQNASALL